MAAVASHIYTFSLRWRGLLGRSCGCYVLALTIGGRSDPTNHRAAETGTQLFRPEHRGKGYGTEAKHLLLSYAFDVLDLHIVWSMVWEENSRSRAALLKQGYREAGCVPWRGIHHGIPSGDWVFDLLASEWQAARR